MAKMDANKYLDILDSIESCLNWYFDNNLSSTRYKLFLSNSERIEIDLGERSLPHLLGVNTDFLRSTGSYTGNASTILEDILNNPNSLLSRINNGYMNENQIFSRHIEKKLSNFSPSLTLVIKKMLSKY